MFNPTPIVVEAFVGELRTMYDRTYGTLEPSHPGIIGFAARVLVGNSAPGEPARIG